MRIPYEAILKDFHSAAAGLLKILAAPEVLTLGKFSELVEGIDMVNQTEKLYRYRINPGEWADVVVFDGDWQNHGSYPGPIVCELAGGIVICEAVPDPQGPEDYVAVSKPGSKAAAYLDLLDKVRVPKDFKYQVHNELPEKPWSSIR